MREDARLQLRVRPLERARNRIALDEFGDFGADHMRTQEFARLGIEHGLDEALRFPERDRLAVAYEWEFSDLDLSPGFFRLGFGEPDARDLRPAIGAARHFGDVERVHALHAGDALGDDDALMHRFVRKPWRADEIADCPHAWHAGLAPCVHHDMRLLDLHARLWEADILDVADDADREDDAVHRDLFGLAVLGLQRRGDLICAFLE